MDTLQIPVSITDLAFVPDNLVDRTVGDITQLAPIVSKSKT
jgi:hypothetical protein